MAKIELDRTLKCNPAELTVGMLRAFLSPQDDDDLVDIEVYDSTRDHEVEISVSKEHPF